MPLSLERFAQGTLSPGLVLESCQILFGIARFWTWCSLTILKSSNGEVTRRI